MRISKKQWIRFRLVLRHGNNDAQKSETVIPGRARNLPAVQWTEIPRQARDDNMSPQNIVLTEH